MTRQKPPEILRRTFDLAVRITKLCAFMDEKPGISRTLGKQLLRSGTSIGANVEEAQAGASTADFTNKLVIALKEARETGYWLRLLAEAEVLDSERLEPLTAEVAEIAKVLAAIIVSKRRNSSAQ